MENWNFNDGGRSKAGFKGKTGDCVTRAISIATGKPYLEVYNELNELCNSNQFRKVKGKHNARKGIPIRVVKKYLENIGFEWKPLMTIGSGCKVHLKSEELPKGTIICRVSGHLVTIKEGIIQDKFDCSRKGTRCVYGYWKQNETFKSNNNINNIGQNEK
jgi:hypothetical protein